MISDLIIKSNMLSLCTQQAAEFPEISFRLSPSDG